MTAIRVVDDLLVVVISCHLQTLKAGVRGFCKDACRDNRAMEDFSVEFPLGHACRRVGIISVLLALDKKVLVVIQEEPFPVVGCHTEG